MTIALAVITDGRRDCISRTIPSALAALQGPITRRIIFDDSGDFDYRVWLSDSFPSFTVLHGGKRQGFGATIALAWAYLKSLPQAYVFHLEDDFLFERQVNLAAMISVLEERPELVQLALRRQPWNAEERAAGGIVEMHPEDYTDRADAAGREWLEHRRHFTTNPSLYRRSLCERGWPDGSHSEGRFGIELRDEHPDWRFGYWGARDSGEWVTHIGHERAGTGY